VDKWGYDEETSRKYNQLRQKGEELIKAKKYAEAVKVWEELATIRPVDALPHQRLAGLYLTKDVNQKDKAIEQLKLLADVEIKDNSYAKRIAMLYRDLNKLPEAQTMAMQAVYIDPYDLAAHKLLARITEKSGDAAVLERERRVIDVIEKWEASQAPATQPTGGD
jgi:tetratricopeptide (TPR) repeat protein